MLTHRKSQSEILPYVFAVLVVFFLFGRPGRQAIEWLLMKLYELFIQGNPLKI